MLFAISFVLIIFSVFSTCTSNIADELKKQFYDQSTECVDANNETHSAFECSGLIIRGVRSDYVLKYGWSLKPRDIEENSFSTGFLRYDTPFNRFPRG